MRDEFTLSASDGTRLGGMILDAPGRPALVFSHGLGTTSDMWAAQVDALAGDYRIVLCDTRGHGRSGAGDATTSISRLGLDVLEILDHLDIARAAFCGLSLGGMIGQHVALRAPDRFSCMILAATSACMGPPSAWQERIASVRAGGMSAIADTVIERWFTPRFRGANAAATARLRKTLMTIDPIGYTACCAAIRDTDMRALASFNQLRTLIVAGTEDEATPMDHTQFLQKSMARADLFPLPGGHMVTIESGDAFSSALAIFLASHAGGGSR